VQSNGDAHEPSTSLPSLEVIFEGKNTTSNYFGFFYAEPRACGRASLDENQRDARSRPCTLESGNAESRKDCNGSLENVLFWG
jgi:hypothetical protein